MIIQDIPFVLRDGRSALLRSPRAEDAPEMLAFFTRASGETEFLLSDPETCRDYSVEREETLLRELGEAENAAMLACLVDGKIVGNCQITILKGRKQRHRATVAIAILREYWGQGIGTRMFRELIRLAEEREELIQLELTFIEGNSRARALYEKMGFRITGVKPNAFRLTDGSLRGEYTMVKPLTEKGGVK